MDGYLSFPFKYLVGLVVSGEGRVKTCLTIIVDITGLIISFSIVTFFLVFKIGGKTPPARGIGYYMNFFKRHIVPFQGAKTRIEKPEADVIGPVAVDCRRLPHDCTGRVGSLLPLSHLESCMGSAGKRVVYLAMVLDVLDADLDPDWLLRHLRLLDCTNPV